MNFVSEYGCLRYSCFSLFLFFLERRSKVEDLKRFGTEDGKMLETNIVDLDLGLFIDTILCRDKSRRSWKK